MGGFPPARLGSPRRIRRTGRRQEAKISLNRLDKADDAQVLLSLDKWEAKAPSSSAAKKKGKGKAKDIAPTPAAKLPTVNDLHVHARLSPARTKRAVERLLEASIIEEVETTVFSGRNNKVPRQVSAYRRKKSITTEPTEPTVNRQSAQ